MNLSKLIISQQQQRMIDHLGTTRCCVSDALEQQLVREIIGYVVGNWRYGSTQLLLFEYELNERQLYVADQTLRALPDLFDLGPREISHQIPALYYLRNHVRELQKRASVTSAH